MHSPGWFDPRRLVASAVVLSLWKSKSQRNASKRSMRTQNSIWLTCKRKWVSRRDVISGSLGSWCEASKESTSAKTAERHSVALCLDLLS